MTQSKAKPRFHIAEAKNPKNDKRQRKRHERKKDARLFSARALLDREEREEVLGRTTFGEAAHAFHELLELKDINDKPKRFERYLRLHIEPIEIAPGCRLVDQELRFLNKDDILAADAAIEALQGSEKVKYTIIAFICEILRFGFGSLPAPIMFPRDIPGRVKKAPFGSGGIRYRQKRVPFGGDIDRRIDAASGPLRILLVLLVHFGLRISEALEVRRIDLDFQPKGKLSWLTVRGTKSPASTRSIPMTETARDTLLAWVSEIDGGLHWQIISDCDTRFYNEGPMRERYDLLENQIGGERFTFHEFRAYFVTAALAGNVSMHHITSWIGHTNMSTTVRYYAGAILLAYHLWQTTTPELSLDGFKAGLRNGKTPAEIAKALVGAG
jgi:integrase